MNEIDNIKQHNPMNHRIGIISKIFQFCDKWNLSKRPGEPIDMIKEALTTMVLRNEFKRVGENPDNISYIKTKILYNEDTICLGYFTPEQLADISELYPNIDFE